MNVFILGTGRCGTTTFHKACQHISNYTSAHESRAGRIFQDRFAYPENHIEADNRLSWFLGRLDASYGASAFYVHLKRDIDKVASSYARRLFTGGVIDAYRRGILLGSRDAHSALDLSKDYCYTIYSNIELFLKDKPNKMTIDIEKNVELDFKKFWESIGAVGDLEAATLEFQKSYNKSVNIENTYFSRTFGKMYRIASKLPRFVQEA